MIKISLPSRLNVNNFSQLFLTTISSEKKPIINSIEIDFSHLSFIEPTGVTVLSNFLEWLISHSVSFTFSGLENYSAPIQFLDDVGFFSRYLGRKIKDTAQIRDTTKPLEFIDTAHSLPWLRENLIFWINRTTGKEPPLLRELLICLQEIFQNIRDHSGTNIGSVFAQIYPNKNVLKLSISDIGVGIPHNIRKHLKEKSEDLTDAECLLQASQYGFTTSSHAGNAGRGLANLKDIVTSIYSGTVIIISNYGFLKFSPEATQHLMDRTWIYPGCLIDIEITLDNISTDQEEDSEFIW